MSASDPGATIKDERVNGIIADYLKAIERSEVPDRAALLSRHAEFAKELSAFFADHDGFRRVAAPLADALTLPPGESLAAPASGPTVRYFGDYELLEEIARGGMGVVYKARQMSLKRPVALKMILAGELATPEARQRFRAEAEAAANLQHPNIVAIHEVGEHQGQQYFSMDFVAGKNLAELVRGNPLSAERAASYVKMVAEAVHFAHQRGTLHRDLKPQNVLIDADDRPRITEGMLELVKACVKARLNIIIAGGTGAGKTTFLNLLSGFIPATERIVTIEDAAELQLRQTHVARLETRPANIEGRGAIAQRHLLINALRMRPDRIVVGEVRGEEALDMLQAMNTGHDGSLTTIHANTPRDAITRLEVMIGMANSNLGTKSIRQQVASAVDLFVQISRLNDGSRKVTYVTECIGMEGETVTTQDIFLFEKTGLTSDGRVSGRFKPTGVRPKFSDRIKAAGLDLPLSIFQNTVEVK